MISTFRKRWFNPKTYFILQNVKQREWHCNNNHEEFSVNNKFGCESTLTRWIDHLTRYAACLCIRLSIVTIADEHKPHFTHNEWMIQNCGFYVCCRIRRWHPHFGPWQFVHQLWLTISPWICWDISARCLANLFAGVVTPPPFHFFTHNYIIISSGNQTWVAGNLL